MNKETMQRIDACLEGSISKEDFQLLQAELREDPVAIDYWIQQSQINGRLEWELSHQTSVMAQVSEKRRRFSGYQWAAIAASLLCVLGVGYFLGAGFQRSSPLPIAKESGMMHPKLESIARVTSEADAEWIGYAPHAGSWVSAGKLHLAKGGAVITFDSGATVRMEAPCEVHLTTQNRVLLESGKAVVDIPRQAFGFVFETPSIEIRRRMSRFAAAVDANGQAEIHVLEGEIQLAGKLGDIDSIALGKNRAIRVDSGGAVIDGLLYDPSTAGASPPESPDLLPEWFVHWGFDITDPNAGTFAETGYNPLSEMKFPAQVHHAHPDASVSLIPGRYGNGVQMNGQLGFIASDFPGIAGSDPRTVSLWVRIDPQTPETLAYSMLSWGAADQFKGEKWQMGWNTGKDNAGITGAIRTEVDGGYIVGSTDLRTGRWHHVVSVFTGGQDADVATHVRHYIDGRLESTTAVKSKLVNTRVSGEGVVPLTIGRRIEKDGYYRTFAGELDEIYLFPSALTPQQIDQLYLKNIPPEIRSRKR